MRDLRDWVFAGLLAGLLVAVVFGPRAPEPAYRYEIHEAQLESAIPVWADGKDLVAVLPHDGGFLLVMRVAD